MSRPLVLIVEDADNVTPLVIALESLPENWDVRTISNGKLALELITAGHTCLAGVVTDVNLPFVDGLALVRAIRAQPRYSGLPVIVVSGNVDTEVSARATKQGANAFFAKPYSPTQVRQKLCELMYAAS